MRLLRAMKPKEYWEHLNAFFVSKESPMDEIEFTVKEDPRPRIPEGPYQVSYAKSNKARYFGTTKLYVQFKIVDQGEFFETVIFKAYNYPDTLTPGCDLYKDLTLLYGQRIRKNTKLKIALFQNKVLRVYVRTVKTNRKQGKLAEFQQYSVIDRIIEVVVGGRAV